MPHMGIKLNSILISAIFLISLIEFCKCSRLSSYIQTFLFQLKLPIENGMQEVLNKETSNSNFLKLFFRPLKNYSYKLLYPKVLNFSTVLTHVDFKLLGKYVRDLVVPYFPLICLLSIRIFLSTVSSVFQHRSCNSY